MLCGCVEVVVEVVVVEWLIIVKELLLLEGLTLTIFFVNFLRRNVGFCFTSNEHCHFSSEKKR